MLISKKINYKIYRFFWKTVDFIYPPVCAGCGAPGSIWCKDCQEKVHEIGDKICPICGILEKSGNLCPECQSSSPPYSALRSWAIFEGPLRTALLSLKYKSDLGLGNIFSIPLINLIQSNHWNFDCIIPMPISKAHKKTRGYNQSSLIARPIALALNKPLLQESVIRIKETKSQVNLSRSERFKNLQSAFLGNPAKLLSKKVLLVDDITTTGATMISCAQALKDAGCDQVFCLTVARTPKHYQ